MQEKVVLYEVGPREGFQIEDGPFTTDQKIMLVNELNNTGIQSIEVTSFVSPKWVPNMADAEEVLNGIERKENISYRTVYLNIKGLQRALKSNVTIDGVISLSASNTFSKKNMNKTIDEILQEFPHWIHAYQDANISVEQIVLMATFGCNYEGDIPLSQVLTVLRMGIEKSEENGHKIRKLKLADTMGWANPEKIKRTIYAIKKEWEDIEIILHLHDTRGLGLANAYSALQQGIREFETAIGGLGGCPFAAVKGAAGNIPTEDMAFMCEEMGIHTNLDLDALLNCAKIAEQIVGHQLPAHLLRGGLFSRSKV
jgi:hydroxymethylglutaryl-CoA lyase